MITQIVKRFATVLLVVLCILILGSLTYSDLPREASPDIDIPFVIVATPYIGVSPADIESLVTVPIENELAGVADLKKMSSTSSEGISIVALEFNPEAKIDEAIQKVRDRVGRARSKLPAEAEESDVREVSFSDVPIVIITLAGGVPLEELKVIGEGLEEEIRRIPGVLDAKLSGGLEREIRVEINPIRLQHYGLAIHDVVGAIQSENVNIPGGNVTAGSANVLVRIPGDITRAGEIEEIAIKRIGDRPVFIRDVARVIDGFAESETYARMNGESAVSIGVTKRNGANILEVATAVKELVAERSDAFPEGVEYRALGDQSKMINDMVSDLENGIATSLILVVLVLIFFMGTRNSLLVAFAIPLSMLLAMMAISLFGMTLNMIVLFSLILALGMLVDNGIVLIENIYRHLEEGKTPEEASIIGTKEIALAVAASTATTVAAFFPLVFWTGIMGQFMGFMPKTIIIVLIASLLVAVFILPSFAARTMKVSKNKPVGPKEPGWLMRQYRSVLGWSIRWRYLVALIGLGSLIGTFVAYAELNHGTEFFPETDPNRATVLVRAPDGTDIEETDAIVRRIEQILSAERNVDVFVAETGVSGGADPMEGSEAAPNQARITVDFLPDANTVKPGEQVRIENTTDTIDSIRAAVAQIPGATINVEKERMGPPVGKPISVELSGDDFHAVGAYAATVRREIAAIQGTTDLGDDYRIGRPELRLRINRAAAKRVGASTQAVAGAVRSAIAGQVASTLRDGDDEYDIVVSLAPEYRDNLQSVLALRIPGREDTSPDTFAVPLSSVASYELAGGSGAIKHIDQDLVITVTGDVTEGTNANEIQTKIVEYIEQAEPPEGVHLRLGGATDEQQDAQEFLGRAFLIALFLIALVLVSQFNRWDLPFIILASVLLSLIGVLWGLVITGLPFSVIMTGLGVISLAGVVVNNAIVLLDYVEQLRDEGMPMREALVQAGMTRFRPVMLTATTTVLGLVPMAIGWSFDFRALRPITGSQSGQWWAPMAVSVIFGLIVATILTLVMVPTMYSIVNDFSRVLCRFLPIFKPLFGWREEDGVRAASPASTGGEPDGAPVADDMSRASTSEGAVTSSDQDQREVDSQAPAAEEE